MTTQHGRASSRATERRGDRGHRDHRGHRGHPDYPERKETRGASERIAPLVALFVVPLVALLAAACSRDAAPPPPAHPADAFLAAIAVHCGNAYEGRIVANEPPAPDDPFAGQRLVMHVRACGQGAVAIPFHVGEDRSRTWVLTRTADGLRLKHDHRHADGSPDSVTLYGGDTAVPGTAGRQEFPVDGESIAMFERTGLTASVQNTWAMEIEPKRRFLYELRRPSGRLFRVEFDLTRPVPTPPAPWGHE